MITIDGSKGEGGGQVLRSALALAIVTGKPFTIENIRARRPKPGLMAQHLRSVEAAAAVGSARVQGSGKGSTRLTFEPREIAPGEYRFDIGTAGSTSLVLQTVLLPLSLAGTPSRIQISGGTHVPWSPCYHYLELQWLPAMRQIGFDFDLHLERAGFYPQGGGILRSTVRRAPRLKPLNLTRRGAWRGIRGISAVSNLSESIAERQRQQALQRLTPLGVSVDIEIQRLPSPGQGTMLLLLAEFANSRCCVYGLGARGKPAERVADEAVDELEMFLGTEAAIDPYLADQLLLPLACSAGVSELTTSRVSQHLVTNADVIRLFLPVEIVIEGDIGHPGRVRLAGQG